MSADLRDDGVAPGEDVGAGEAQQLDPGVEQPILASVVFGEVVAMDCAVVFDAEAAVFVIEVEPACKLPSTVVNLELCRGPGQTAEHEGHSKARLHGRLGGGLREIDDPAKVLDPSTAVVRVCPRRELLVGHDAGMEGHIGDDDRFNELEPAAELAKCP